MSKKIENLQRSESGQFVLVAQMPGQEPRVISEAPMAFRPGLNAARNLAKDLKANGGKAKLSYLPEVFVYDVEPGDASEPYKIVLAPVEYYGIAPTPKPEKPVKEPKPAKEPKPKAEKKSKKKVDVEGTTSGSETLPELTATSEA